MEIVVAQDRGDLGSFVAEAAASSIRESINSKGSCNLVVATGSSQFEVLDSLVKQPNIDWASVNGFHLDEYLGLSSDHSASFCGYLKTRFVDRVSLGSFHYMDGTLPPDQVLSTANAKIQDQTIDLLLCGIGENGHLAFNDPPADFTIESPYLIVELDEACRRQQVGEGWFDTLADVPDRAISMSIQQIMKAEKILCSVPDRRKAKAVQATLEGPITPEAPASILQKHANATLILDQGSSSELSEATLASAERICESSPN